MRLKHPLLAKHWIPPGALGFAQLAQGVSWPLLAYAALSGDATALTPAAIAWIHTVALGWLTMAALGILVHVVPAFTDLSWKGERVVRGSLVPFAAGATLFVAGWLTHLAVMQAGAVLILVAFAAYYFVAMRTLGTTEGIEPTERAIARALRINLSLLLVVVVLGALMAFAFTVPALSGILVHTPPIHANFAVYGWITMLVFGVSARTVRPICGVRSRFPWIHIVTGTSLLAGPVVIAAGILSGSSVITIAGAALLGVATLVYAFDVVDILRRATVGHRPPQAFIGAAIFWLVVSTGLAAAAVAGAPCWNAFIFVVLMGWAGQMVNAHFFHIGIRLLATVYRGEEDETRPGEVLDARLSWSCFAVMQLAVVLCAAGLAIDVPLAVAAGAACGFISWVLFLANARTAVTNLRALPIDLLSR